MSRERELALAIDAAIATLAAVWDTVREGASLAIDHNGARVSLNIRPLAQSCGSPAPTPSLFDNTPEVSDLPEIAPLGVRPADWRAVLAVRDLRAAGHKKVCRKQITAQIAKKTGNAESEHSVAHALPRMMRLGYLRQISRAEGYALGERAGHKAQSSAA